MPYSAASVASGLTALIARVAPQDVLPVAQVQIDASFASGLVSVLIMCMLDAAPETEGTLAIDYTPGPACSNGPRAQPADAVRFVLPQLRLRPVPPSGSHRFTLPPPVPQRGTAFPVR